MLISKMAIILSSRFYHRMRCVARAVGWCRDFTFLECFIPLQGNFGHSTQWRNLSLFGYSWYRRAATSWCFEYHDVRRRHDDHHRIFEAVMAREPWRAEMLMRGGHFASIKTSLVGYLSERKTYSTLGLQPEENS